MLLNYIFAECSILYIYIPYTFLQILLLKYIMSTRILCLFFLMDRYTFLKASLFQPVLFANKKKNQSREVDMFVGPEEMRMTCRFAPSVFRITPSSSTTETGPSCRLTIPPRLLCCSYFITSSILSYSRFRAHCLHTQF